MKTSPTFSFTYNNIKSDQYLVNLIQKIDTIKLDNNRTQTTQIWIDTKTDFQVSCVAVEYSDFPVIEWTMYFKNCGNSDTAILKDIKVLDKVITRDSEKEFVLHGNKGEWCVAESYEPYELTLTPGMEKLFAPKMGKSTNGAEGWPYYNLQMQEGGIILAIGWPGQWSSSFTRDDKEGLRITAGQELTNLYLKPGEEIRTPLVALLTWKGESVTDAQNLWRRWFWKHNTPRINDVPPSTMANVILLRKWDFSDSEKILWEEINKFLAVDVKPDVCWKDAGWYPHFDGPEQGDLRWTNTGTWEPDTVRFPNGFRLFSNWIHQQGMKFMLWFEPERVGDPESFLGKHHSEWLLESTETEEFGKTYGKILNLGNEKALNWLINHVDTMIKNEGIDWYRQDMNGPGPLLAWRNADEEDRQGITENFYIQGHLKFWDELLRRNPELHIDTCASGGRRNDLETMRRAVPLTRSDYLMPDDVFPQGKQVNLHEINQGHTYGIATWFPYYGAFAIGTDKYKTRSLYMPAFAVCSFGDWDEATGIKVKKAYDECRKVAPMMLCDYYPLTPYTLDLDKWMAWQFNNPEDENGMVQAFRHAENKEEKMILKLNGLDASKIYEVLDFDTNISCNVSGKSLLEEGLAIKINTLPGSALFSYRLLK